MRSHSYLKPWNKAELCGWSPLDKVDIGTIELDEFGDITSDVFLCDDEDRIECEKKGMCTKCDHLNQDRARKDFRACRKVLVQNYTFLRVLERKLSSLEKKKLQRRMKRVAKRNEERLP